MGASATFSASRIGCPISTFASPVGCTSAVPRARRPSGGWRLCRAIDCAIGIGRGRVRQLLLIDVLPGCQAGDSLNALGTADRIQYSLDTMLVGDAVWAITGALGINYDTL